MMQHHHGRITLEDTPMSAIIKLAEGIPGAVTVMAELFKAAPIIDPDAAFGGIAPILGLDIHAIYGSRIWVLYKDCCGQSPERTMAALRAVQIGLKREEELNAAIDSSTPIDWVAIVQESLPNFAQNGNTRIATPTETLK